MIIRILGEGQFDVPDQELEALNALDDELQAAIEAGNEEEFRSALTALLEKVRSGKPVPPEDLVSSKLILPAADASLHEVRDLLSGDGLIPG